MINLLKLKLFPHFFSLNSKSLILIRPLQFLKVILVLNFNRYEISILINLFTLSINPFKVKLIGNTSFKNEYIDKAFQILNVKDLDIANKG